MIQKIMVLAWVVGIKIKYQNQTTFYIGYTIVGKGPFLLSEAQIKNTKRATNSQS